MGVVLSGLVLYTLSWGQPAAVVPTRLEFFACGRVTFFDESCGAVVDTIAVPSTAVPDATSSTASDIPQSVAADAPPPPGEPADEPLFTPATVSPDTPPVLLQLLQEPTEDNARRFLAWHQARLARIQQVEALLREMNTAENDVAPPPLLDMFPKMP
jgi:hypothetical protein